MDNIEALSERLGFLQITNKTSDETTEQSDEAMSVAPVPKTTNISELKTIDLVSILFSLIFY